MSNLIEEIHQCLLALYHGEKAKYRTFDLVLLKDRFEASHEYSSSSYNLLRSALNDLMQDGRQKLNHYLKMGKHVNRKNLHVIVQDIYEWAGTDREAYFERYIQLLEHPETNAEPVHTLNPTKKGRSRKKVKAFRSYLIVTIDECVIADFLRKLCDPDSIDTKPAVMALYVWKLFNVGLFQNAIQPEQFYINNDFARSFYKFIGKADRPDNMRTQLKEVFELPEEERRKSWAKIDNRIRRSFEKLKEQAKLKEG